MSENKENLARIRAIRGGNRGVITKLINETEVLLKEEILNRGRLKTITDLLEEKLKIVKALDEKVVENCEVNDIEIEESDDLISRVLDTKRHILEKTSEETTTEFQQKKPDNVSTPKKQQSQQQLEQTTPGVSENTTTESIVASQSTSAEMTGTVKLPKLTLPKFRGEVTQWRTFWDSFNSAIHTNSYLSNIDKFNHLKSLLEGQASRAVQGLTLSENNYQSAVDILHQRFGKTQHIISTHMDELLKIPECSGDKASQLRFVYDKISINVRGLEALGVNSSQYGSLLIPVVMSKLRIQIARNTIQEVWEISDLLNVIQKEVEAREISESIKATIEKPKKQPSKPSTAAALLANGNRQPGGQINCVYCSGNHYSASCDSVSESRARVEILRKERRCFVCLRTGHRSIQCAQQKSCRRCHGRHHQSICDQPFPPLKSNQKESAAPSKRDHETRNSNPLTPPAAPFTENQTVNTATVQVRQTTTATTSANMKGKVMLQTATATATDQSGTKCTKVKILFDSGSQRSYVTDNLKSRLNLKPKKTEMLQLNTFGERNY